MKIDLACNPSLLKGVLNIERTDSGLRLFRHPDHLRYMPGCTAGCRIAFRTNAALFKLQLLIPAPIHISYHLAVDLLIDHHYIRSFELPNCEPETPPRELVCEAALPGHEAGVEIYLPNYHSVFIQSFEISTGAWLTPLSYSGAPLLFLGDSITQGFYAGASRCWSSLVARKWDSDFFNMGTGGAKMAEAPGNIAMTVPWKRAFVSYGVNDSGPNGLSADQLFEQTTQLLSLLSGRAGGRIYLLTPVPFLAGDAQRQERLELFRRTIARAGAAFPQVKVIDGHSLVAESADCFFDGCHPNEKGMAMFAQNLLKQIE